MTTNGNAALPSAEHLAELVEDFTRVWQLVPRSARPVNKGLYERIHRQLVRIHHYVESRKIQIAGAADGEDGDEGDPLDDPPLAIVMRALYMCTEEQWEQAQILMRMRRLSDLGRSELFAEQEDSHCVHCGQFDPVEPHECPALVDGDGETTVTAGGDPPPAAAPEVPDLVLTPSPPLSGAARDV